MIAFRQILLGEHIHEGAVPRKGWGLAWWDALRCQTVYYLIPFNVLIRGCRLAYHWFLSGVFRDRWGTKLRETWAEGYGNGYDKGRQDQIDQVVKHFQRAVEQAGPFRFKHIIKSYMRRQGTESK